MGTEAYNLVISLYREEFQYSQSRKPTYWKETDKLPAYVNLGLSSTNYIWKLKGSKKLLFDTIKQEFVVKNSKSVGTPRVMSINSQPFWSGGMGSEWVRMRMKDVVKAEFVPYIARHLPLKIFAPKGKFIQIEFIFFFPFKFRTKQYQDYINHWFVRQKIFEDTLVDMKVITDDNPDILRGGYGRYVEIDEEHDRRLEIKIHFCNNGERIN